MLKYTKKLLGFLILLFFSTAALVAMNGTTNAMQIDSGSSHNGNGDEVPAKEQLSKDQEEQSTCEICKKVCLSFQGLRAHMRLTHHKALAYKYECACGFHTDLLAVFIYHKSVEDQVAELALPFVCRRMRCNTKFFARIEARHFHEFGTCKFLHDALVDKLQKDVTGLQRAAIEFNKASWELGKFNKNLDNPFPIPTGSSSSSGDAAKLLVQKEPRQRAPVKDHDNEDYTEEVISKKITKKIICRIDGCTRAFINNEKVTKHRKEAHKYGSVKRGSYACASCGNTHDFQSQARDCSKKNAAVPVKKVQEEQRSYPAKFSMQHESMDSSTPQMGNFVCDICHHISVDLEHGSDHMQKMHPEVILTQYRELSAQTCQAQVTFSKIESQKKHDAEKYAASNGLVDVADAPEIGFLPKLNQSLLDAEIPDFIRDADPVYQPGMPKDEDIDESQPMQLSGVGHETFAAEALIISLTRGKKRTNEALGNASLESNKKTKLK